MTVTSYAVADDDVAAFEDFEKSQSGPPSTEDDCCALSNCPGFESFLRLLVLDTIQPHDNFVCRMRKIGFAVFFVLGIVLGALAVITFAVGLSQPLATRPHVVNLSALGVLSFVVLSFIPIYAVFRRTGDPTPLLLGLKMVAADIGILCNALITPGPSAPVLCAYMALYGIIVSMPFRWWNAVFLTGVATYSCVDAMLDRALSFRDVRSQQVPESIILVIACNVMGFVFVASFLKAYDESLERANRSASRAHLASGMAARLAEYVARYDTEAMGTALSAYEGSIGCDRRLLRSFTDIQKNLHRYRPHLPNYVLRASQQDQQQEDNGGAGADAVAPFAALGTEPTSSLGHSRRGEGASTADSFPKGASDGSAAAAPGSHGKYGGSNGVNGTLFAPLDAVEVVGSAAFSMSSKAVSSGGAESSVRRGGDPNALSFHDSQTMTPVQSARSALLPPLMSLGGSYEAYRGFVALARIDFDTFRVRPTPGPSKEDAEALRLLPLVQSVGIGSGPFGHSGLPPSASPAAHATDPSTRRTLALESVYHSVVAKLQKVATTTQGSVHSFVGDSLVLSWNGTQRLHKPEVKAMRFALRARHILEEAYRRALTVNARQKPGAAGHDVALFGAVTVVSGEAFCLFAGDDQQRTFMLSPLDRSSLRGEDVAAIVRQVGRIATSQLSALADRATAEPSPIPGLERGTSARGSGRLLAGTSLADRPPDCHPSLLFVDRTTHDSVAAHFIGRAVALLPAAEACVADQAPAPPSPGGSSSSTSGGNGGFSTIPVSPCDSLPFDSVDARFVFEIVGDRPSAVEASFMNGPVGGALTTSADNETVTNALIAFAQHSPDRALTLLEGISDPAVRFAPAVMALVQRIQAESRTGPQLFAPPSPT